MRSRTRLYILILLVYTLKPSSRSVSIDAPTGFPGMPYTGKDPIAAWLLSDSCLCSVTPRSAGVDSLILRKTFRYRQPIAAWKSLTLKQCLSNHYPRLHKSMHSPASDL
jgi:hypothetical protein